MFLTAKSTRTLPQNIRVYFKRPYLILNTFTWGSGCPLTGSWDWPPKIAGNWDLSLVICWDSGISRQLTGIVKKYSTGNWDSPQKLAGNWDLGPPIQTLLHVFNVLVLQFSDGHRYIFHFTSQLHYLYNWPKMSRWIAYSIPVHSSAIDHSNTWPWLSE